MADYLVVVGIIAGLVILGIVLLARTKPPTLQGRQQDILFRADDRRCSVCGCRTIYEIPVCPECAARLRQGEKP